MAALRSALAAIDNAEAVEVAHLPVGDPHPTVAGSLTGLWAGEAPRRELSDAEVAELVRREVVERRAAAGDYERLGRVDRADRLRAEAEVLAAYLLPEGHRRGPSAVAARYTMAEPAQAKEWAQRSGQGVVPDRVVVSGCKVMQWQPDAANGQSSRSGPY